MKTYLALLEKILIEGAESKDRTGTGTSSLFSESLKFDLQEGFPLVTTKFVNYKAVLAELLWFVQGFTNISMLDSQIWNEWATERGSVGPMYGSQWRNWLGKPCIWENEIYYEIIDQLADVIKNIQSNPFSRRHVVTAWNPTYLPKENISPQQNVLDGNMALAPCHKDFQFYVRNGELSLHWNQRSVDVFLGLPFNIASYATLLIMVSNLCNLKPKILSFHGVDVHLYNNHRIQATTQILRKPKSLSKLIVNPAVKDINSYTTKDFALENYLHHEKLSGKISI